MSELQKAAEWVVEHLRCSTVKDCRKVLEEALSGTTSSHSDGRQGVQAVPQTETTPSPQPTDSTGGDSSQQEAVGNPEVQREGKGVDDVPARAQDPTQDYRQLAIGENGRNYACKTCRGDIVNIHLREAGFSKVTPDGKNLVFYDTSKRFLASVRIAR